MPRAAAIVALILLTLVGPVAAGPAESVIRLVPPQTSFCVVVQNLRDHVHTIAASPFAGWLSGVPVVQQVSTGPEADKLRAAAGFLRDQFGVSPAEAIDDIFGDAVVFAYIPGPSGEPQKEAGVILIKPRNPDSLTRLVNKLNDLQTQAGELKAVSERKHQGQPYSVREKKVGGAEFYALRDGIFAFSGQERAIQIVLERAANEADEPNAVTSGLRRLGLMDHAVVGWFDPRAFDADLMAKHAAATDPKDRAFLAQFKQIWSAVDAAAVFAQPGKGFEIGVKLALRKDAIPADTAAVFFPPTGASAAWNAVPTDAIAAAGGRAEVPRVLATIASFLPAEEKEKLTQAVEGGLGPVFGRDKLPAVLRGLGPDWAAWTVAPTDGWLPQGAFVVRLADAEVAKAVAQAVDFGFQFARVGYNQSHPDQVEYGEETHDGVTVKFLSNPVGFPPGMRPSFAVKGGYLIVATSPAMVKQFTPPTAKPAAAAPLVRISAGRLRDYLTRHQAAIAEAIAAKDHRPVKDVVKDFERLRDVLAALDRLELRYDATGDRVSLSVVVETVKPLK